MPVAAQLRKRLIESHGRDGAFPAPGALIEAIEQQRLVLPGRKAEYLAAVARAALDGLLTGPHLRALPEEAARAQLLSITGIGPFAADLILIRGPTRSTSYPAQNTASTWKSLTSTARKPR